MVLARRPAGRRRAERHDVSQPRARPLPPHQTGRAARSLRHRGLGPDRHPNGAQPEYRDLPQEMMSPEVDYRRRPSEDFARATVIHRRRRPAPGRRGHYLVELRRRRAAPHDAAAGPRVLALGATSTTAPKCSSVAPPARIRGRGPAREAERRAGPDALLGNEYAEYGYEAENRAVRHRVSPPATSRNSTSTPGGEVTELLMACYMSAEQGRVMRWKPEGLASYVPPVARAGRAR